MTFISRLFVLFGALFGFWVVLSGIYTPFLLFSGFFSALAVTALSARMGLLGNDDTGIRWSLSPLAYTFWLLAEIVKSGWQVSKIILHPALPISPALTRFHPSQRSTVGLVIHANSITLTPGTLTIEADKDVFLIHALSSAGMPDEESSEMDRRVRGLEVAA